MSNFFFLSGDSAKKQSLIFEAVDYGLKAIEIDEFNSEAHKWYAIVIGSRGEYLGIKEKILDGYEFKKHIDRASELSPQDHTIRLVIPLSHAFGLLKLFFYTKK